MARTKGSTTIPWTEREWAVIRAELDARPGRTSGRIKRLSPLLPGRSSENIFNSLHRERFARKELCACGRPLAEEHKQCQKCLDKGLKRRKAKLRKGLCLRCGEPIDDRGSTTTCSICTQKRREMWKKMNAKKKSKKPTKVTYNLLKWLASRNADFVVKVIPKGSLVVDLFGGSGDMALRAAKDGHDVIGYNDIHPMLVAFMRVLKAGKGNALCGQIQAPLKPKAIQLLPKLYIDAKGLAEDELVVYPKSRHFEPTPDDASLWNLLVLRASLLYRVARSVKGRDMTKLDLGSFNGLASGARKRMEEAEGLLEDVEITCLDAVTQAIPYYDCPSTLFLCDPPWPHAEKYEYDFALRHRELVDALLSAKGQFILTMQSSKASLIAMKPCPYLYFFVTHGGPRCLIGSDLPLTGDGRLRSVDKSAFGYLKGR